jgi:murein DD-endopeptidase MepM/ murein hydrolase activator NlpD
MSGIVSPTKKQQKPSTDVTNINGISISGNLKTAIKSIVAGTVIHPLFIKANSGYTLWIKGNNDLIYVYSNLWNKSRLNPGDKVNQGDTIGHVGNSTGSTNSIIYRNKTATGNSILKIYRQTKSRLEEIIPRKVIT